MPGLRDAQIDAGAVALAKLFSLVPLHKLPINQQEAFRMRSRTCMEAFENMAKVFNDYDRALENDRRTIDGKIVAPALAAE